MNNTVWTIGRRFEGEAMSDERTLERFWAKVEVDEETGCWEWVASKKPDGYAQFEVNGKQVYVHRFSWEAANGPIPDGLQLDHLCRVRHCVNPDHLEPVDGRTNTLRGDTLPAANVAKTECVNGHPFDETNTYVRADGRRDCRECHRRALERYRLRQRAVIA